VIKIRDLVIIGAGAAGFSALIRANELGIKPTLINFGLPLGGTCVNVGCIPSKRLLRICEEYSTASRIIGKRVYPELFDAIRDKDNIVRELRKEKYEDVLSKYDVEYIEGRTYFISPKSIKVNGKEIEGKKFIIATGSSPSIPNIPGLKEVGYWTSNEALNPDRKISSLIIIGGRAVALEFAQIYSRLGVEVTILQRSPVLIPNWEPEISLLSQEILEEDGVNVFTNVQVIEVRKEGGKKIVKTNLGEFVGDEILVATGRRPNTNIGLENAGVELNENGGVKVDEELRTTNPNIFAAGDVIGGPMLESLAGKEGAIAVDNALRNAGRKIDFLSIPQAIFIQPNLAKVGLTVLEARKKMFKVDYRVVKMRDVPKARLIRSKGLIKMVVDSETKRILGVHVVAENAAEIINEAALAIRLRATIYDIIDTIHVFPTISESVKIAALAFEKDVSKISCCVE